MPKVYAVISTLLGLGFALTLFVLATTGTEGYRYIWLSQFALYLFSSSTIGLFVARAAMRKGKDFTPYYWLSILVTPILTGLVVAFIPEITKPLTCPKCGGTDFYNGKLRVVKGIGGIYGNRQGEVLASFCRKCDIEML